MFVCFVCLCVTHSKIETIFHFVFLVCRLFYSSFRVFLCFLRVSMNELLKYKTCQQQQQQSNIFFLPKKNKHLQHVNQPSTSWILFWKFDQTKKNIKQNLCHHFCKKWKDWLHSHICCPFFHTRFHLNEWCDVFIKENFIIFIHSFS